MRKEGLRIAGTRCGVLLNFWPHTAARDGFEIMKTDEMRVQSRWRVDGEVREYVGWGAVPDEVAECMIERVCEANAGVEGYTADDARESLRGRMEESVRYKMVIHVGDVRADGVGGAAAPPSPSPLHTHTHGRCGQETDGTAADNITVERGIAGRDAAAYGGKRRRRRGDVAAQC